MLTTARLAVILLLYVPDNRLLFRHVTKMRSSFIAAYPLLKDYVASTSLTHNSTLTFFLKMSWFDIFLKIIMTF